MLKGSVWNAHCLCAFVGEIQCQFLKLNQGLRRPKAVAWNVCVDPTCRVSSCKRCLNFATSQTQLGKKVANNQQGNVWGEKIKENPAMRCVKSFTPPLELSHEAIFVQWFFLASTVWKRHGELIATAFEASKPFFYCFRRVKFLLRKWPTSCFLPHFCKIKSKSGNISAILPCKIASCDKNVIRCPTREYQQILVLWLLRKLVPTALVFEAITRPESADIHSWAI